MSTALEIAQLYFHLSNNSDFNEIKNLFTDSTTYSSQNTGLFLGVESIQAMQKDFHNKFSSLHWTINSIEKVKTGIILVDYNFVAQSKSGDEVKSSGFEYIVVHNDKILHIEIRNK